MQISWKATGLYVYNNWNMHNSKMSKAVQRLSSGKRINSAADDVAGFAISEKMKAQLTVMARQKTIAADAISAAETADGAMASVHSMLNRMTDLTTMASSGSLSDQDRALLDIEYQELLKEIDSIAKHTNFNGTNLFNDSFMADDARRMAESSGSASSKEATTIAEPITMTGIDLSDYLDALDRLMGGWKDGPPQNLRETVMEFTRDYAKSLGATTDSKTGITSVDGGAAGGFSITIKGNNIELRQEGYTGDKLGLGGSNLLSQESASKAMDAVKKATDIVSKQRAQYGATQRRLEHRISSLTAMEQNLTDAENRISGADMAKEYMNFMREKMLAEVSTVMMTHVRTQSQQVLQLLY